MIDSNRDREIKKTLAGERPVAARVTGFLNSADCRGSVENKKNHEDNVRRVKLKGLGAHIEDCTTTHNIELQ